MNDFWFIQNKCNAYSLSLNYLPLYNHSLIHAKCIHFLEALTIHHTSSPFYLTFFNDFGWKYDLFRLTRRIVFTRLIDNWLITLTKLCLRNICKNVCVGRLFIYFLKNRNCSFTVIVTDLQFCIRLCDLKEGRRLGKKINLRNRVR